MNRWLSGSIVAVTMSLFAPSALAHITLTFPPPREAAQKAGPCGTTGSVRGANVTTFKPGDKITVTWTETVEHPGHFRISFDDNGNDNFIDPMAYDDFNNTPNVISDNITDQTGAAPHTYSQEITIPNMECDNCTLQLLQVMTDKPPFGPGGGNDFYFQCADIRISTTGGSSSAAASSGSGSGSGSASSSTTTGSASGGGGGGGGGSGGESGGGGGDGCSCRVGGGEGGSAAALALVALALLSKARRTRR